MELYSTKKISPNVSIGEAVLKGLPDDNGLYMPVQIPELPKSFFDGIEKMTFQDIGFTVSQALLGKSVDDQSLRKILAEAFDFETPLVKIKEGFSVLELFHGPTAAFKDFGARFMSRLMRYFLQQTNQEINILVATSGDTGSAVGHGFLGVEGIRVTILYPKGKVSDIQEKQLTTIGGNVSALEIDGTFDDCQRLVKSAFLDEELSSKLNLTSANSINIARLIPQSFYYFHAYAQLKSDGKPVVFSVPSGNFGNLCGGLIAKKMGLPIAHFIASTNVNDIVPEYLRSGVFHARPSIETISNAMDVGNPSNFPRMLALHDWEYDKIKNEISAFSFDDNETKQAMREVFNECDYTLCPHTAVAYLGLKNWLQEQHEAFNGVLLSTAHPAKFIDVVEETLKAKILIPERLQEALSKEKVAQPMSGKFDDFKSWLLG
ncbi:threonine synthase [Fulvivirgaceae bacterium BMA10]|uniref:Threonine synthase n=1 Tax=Splendidivirga corallicola TaxID=3051826 RepID=A0ABT8KM76_9BACT|nr:threonine synthase [Fulvivirgaceae bacterium BMA10]